VKYWQNDFSFSTRFCRSIEFKFVKEEETEVKIIIEKNQGRNIFFNIISLRRKNFDEAYTFIYLLFILLGHLKSIRGFLAMKFLYFKNFYIL